MRINMDNMNWSKVCSQLLLMLCVSASFHVSAHQVRMSVYVEESTLEGEIYFVGGGNPPGANAQVELKKGDKILQTTVADQEGWFVFDAVPADSYSLRADAGEGHVAYYELDKSEFPETISSEPTVTTAVTTESQQPASSAAQTASLTPQQLQKAISQAVRPLRQQIDRYEAKTRLHDIIGGIGYIFGLFGLFMFINNRKQQWKQS